MIRKLTHLQRLNQRAFISCERSSRRRSDRSCCIRQARILAVMLHLARKAFYPSIPPFPLLHVDTTWKFRDMYLVRDTAGRGRGHGTGSFIAIPKRWRGASTPSTTACSIRICENRRA